MHLRVLNQRTCDRCRAASHSLAGCRLQRLSLMRFFTSARLASGRSIRVYRRGSPRRTTTPIFSGNRGGRVHFDTLARQAGGSADCRLRTRLLIVHKAQFVLVVISSRRHATSGDILHANRGAVTDTRSVTAPRAAAAKWAAHLRRDPGDTVPALRRIQRARGVASRCPRWHGAGADTRLLGDDDYFRVSVITTMTGGVGLRYV